MAIVSNISTQRANSMTDKDSRNLELVKELLCVHHYGAHVYENGVCVHCEATQQGVAIMTVPLASTIKSLTTSTSTMLGETITTENLKQITTTLNSSNTSGTEITADGSQYPVYMSFNKATGILDFHTPAENGIIVKGDPSSLFSGRSNLTDIGGLSVWDVSQVTSLYGMFRGTKISSVSALSSWNVTKVTNMNYMFYECSNLTDASPLDDWNASNASKTNMFSTTCTTKPSWY